MLVQVAGHVQIVGSMADFEEDARLEVNAEAVVIHALGDDVSGGIEGMKMSAFCRKFC